MKTKRTGGRTPAERNFKGTENGKRIEHAEDRIEQTEARTKRAEMRIAQAESHAKRSLNGPSGESHIEKAEILTELAKTRMEQAEIRTELAKTRTEQAELRVEHAEERAKHAERVLQHVATIGTDLDKVISPIMLADASEEKSADQKHLLGKLTERQRMVFQLIAEGQNTKQIAEVLDISPKTVEFHRLKMMKALNLHDITGLVRLALRAGVISQRN